MKKKNLILALFIMFLGFGFMLNVHAEDELPKITKATNMLSTQIKVEYDLASCKYEKCGIIVLNANWAYKDNQAMILRPKGGAGYKVYDGLNRGETYKFAVALYWFDENGGYHNSSWSWAAPIKAEAPTNKIPTNLDITTMPTKTEYIEGETFDPTGMKLKVTYNTGDSAEIQDGKGCTFSPSKIEKDTTQIRITCEGVFATQSIKVSEKTIEEITEITSKPNKGIYEDGEYFDPTGMKIKVKYNNELTEELDVTKDICKFVPDQLTVGTDKVIVKCGNDQTSVSVTVNAKEVTLENISIKTEATKKEYIEGERFNSDGMVITYKYSDGTTVDKNVSEEVSNNKCTINPNGELSKNDTKVTITCSGKSVDQNITVVNKYITGITAKTPATKTIYQEGETFDPTGMEVEATYNDNSKNTLNIKEEIENGTCTFSPNTPLTKDVTSVKITCTGNIEITQQITVKETVTVSVVVQNGTVETASKTIDYNTNTAFNITPIGEDYTSAYVNCTNNQTGTYNNKILTLNNVTSNTTCTVKLVNEMTTLYNDGTLIINEQLKDRSANISKHGAVTNKYVAMDNDNPYTFNSSPVIWKNERINVKSVEIGRTIKPTSTAYWFDGFTNMEKGDFTNLDTSNVTDMSYMFYNAGKNVLSFKLNLSNLNTSKVTDISNMFYNAGANASTWNVGDLSSWDTSNVTNMMHMFDSIGQNSKTWTLGNISNWNTSKVTDMSGMFSYVGKNITTFNLDLSRWDTSNVTNMGGMFAFAGAYSTDFNLILDGWDTSKVTSMVQMFAYAGSYEAETFNLDLSRWDTSSVTNMYNMFKGAGENTEALSWTISIPKKTGTLSNTGERLYGASETIYESNPSFAKKFTLS